MLTKQVVCYWLGSQASESTHVALSEEGKLLLGYLLLYFYAPKFLELLP